MNVLAIDQGTSSTKALVVAEDGEVLGESNALVHPQAGAHGAVEQDPQELLDSIFEAGRAALAAAGASVEAVGLANQGETVLRWNRETGEPYGPALSWQDRRAVSVTRDLAAHEDVLTEITGLPVDPYFAAPKMTWLRRAQGEEGVVTTVDAWLNQRLAGAFVTDAATASRTMLLDLDLDRIGPGGHEELFVPSLAGLGAPFWAPEARGGWLGLSLATRRDDLVRAVVWGIAAQVASLAKAMENDLGRPLERLRVDGGLTRSASLMQAQADLLQVPVELYPSPDATALGAGALARLGIGGAATPAEAVGDWSSTAVFEPKLASAEADERLARWDA